MKIHRFVALAVVFVTAFIRLHAQDEASGILKNSKQAESIIHTIVNDHELMLKLISAIKENDHARMMIDHLLGQGNSSTMDHEHSPMNEGSSHADSQESPTKRNPYVGEEMRSIKSLSNDDIAKYLNGEGMGLAKAAELNRYPGPKHVLELADRIGLSGEQKVKSEKAFDDMHVKAQTLGKQIVEKETALDKLFASGKITEEKLGSMLNDIGRLTGELRKTHLEAHLRMRKILSEEQVARYAELRGYSSGMNHEGHQH